MIQKNTYFQDGISLKARGLTPIVRGKDRKGRRRSSHYQTLAECAGMIAASVVACIIVLLALASCSDNHTYDQMPERVDNFIARYFPGYSIDTYDDSDNEIRVKLKNGPEITFNDDYYLKEIIGYGDPLPQMLLYDTLPPALYKYIEGNRNLGQVYNLEFTPRTVSVVLQDYSLIYNNQTGKITQVTTPPM